MGGAEIAWRVHQALRDRAGKLGLGLVRRPPAPACPAWGAPFIAGLVPPASQPAVLAQADRLLAGRWDVFALREAPLGFPPEWNRDPRTGTLAPMGLGRLIDYRRVDAVGNIKYLWEPSRHLELVTLALAYKISGQRRYADAVGVLLRSWFAQCPYPQGVHWSSALELAVRLLNWSCAWQLLGGADAPLFADAAGQALRRQWLASVYQHCHFIAHNLSRHSSANNHLFGEYTGLYVASLTWPCWPASGRWQALARRGLEQESVRQNGADGVNREQAIYYHHEVMDMMLLSQLAGQANGQPFPPACVARLERMAEFVAALLDGGGHLPMLGDGDDAHLVRLAFQDDWCPFRSLLASCAVLYGRADFARKAGGLDDKTRCLLGADGERRWDALAPAAAEAPALAFPEGGYYLLGQRFGQRGEVRLVADCGPLGYLSIAAHGHADALAFTLSLDGQQCLIDPGTYTYRPDSPWRDYFRGTAAHNTVCIDGLDQSEIGGNFMWLKKARARLLGHQPHGALQWFEGEHDGYARLADPLIHRRRVDYDAPAGRLRVADTLRCAGQHEAAVHWHFSDTCAVELVDGQVWVHGHGWRLSLRCAGARVTLLRGSEQPRGGWIARRFDSKTPSTTVVCQVAVRGTTEIVTEMAIEQAAC